jgi:2'-5' RNA ligase
VAHSIELIFDDATDAALRRDWTALAEAGLPSQARHRSPTNRPHVTLAVSERISAAVDEELTEAARSLPMPCRIGAVVVFGRRSLTVVRLVIPSESLLRLHRDVHERSVGHQDPGPFPHALPGQWTPHVTVCRRLPPGDLPAALEVLGADDVAGTFAALRRWDGDARIDTVIGV